MNTRLFEWRPGTKPEVHIVEKAIRDFGSSGKTSIQSPIGGVFSIQFHTFPWLFEAQICFFQRAKEMYQIE